MSASQTAFIRMFYVIPAAWGTGVASLMLEEVLAAVKGAGHRSVRLQVVEPQTRARRFYEREGWRIDPDVPAGTNQLCRLLFYRRDL